MEYSVKGQRFSYDAQGEKIWGADSVLLADSIDLTAHKPWHETGYTIERLFDEDLYNTFTKKCIYPFDQLLARSRVIG